MRSRTNNLLCSRPGNPCMLWAVRAYSFYCNSNYCPCENPLDDKVHGVRREEGGCSESPLIMVLNHGTPGAPGTASGDSVTLQNEEKRLAESYVKMRTVLRKKTIASEGKFSKELVQTSWRRVLLPRRLGACVFLSPPPNTQKVLESAPSKPHRL